MRLPDCQRLWSIGVCGCLRRLFCLGEVLVRNMKHLSCDELSVALQIKVEKLASCVTPGEGEELEEAHLKAGDQIQLEGAMYTVVKTLTDKVWAAELDRPFEWSSATVEQEAKKEGVVWLMLLRHIVRHDRDMQLMVFNLQGGAIIHSAVSLLSLPFDRSTICVKDLNTRAVMRSVYRLLKAFVAHFRSGQSFLAPFLSMFLPDCEANLVSLDISPMGCINSTFKDNHANCAAIDHDAVYKVVQLAAQTHPPRMLRFLSNLIEAKGNVIVSNQLLIVQALDTKESALLLYDSQQQREKLAALIAEGDHEKNPRGKLCYHIELMKLLVLATKGDIQQNARWVKSHISLAHMTSMLETSPMIPALLAAYLDLFRNVFLAHDRRRGGSATGDTELDFGVVEKTLRGLVAQLTATLDPETKEPGPARHKANTQPTSLPDAARLPWPHAQATEVCFGSLLPALHKMYVRYPDLLEGEDDSDIDFELSILQSNLVKLSGTINQGDARMDEYTEAIRGCLIMLPSGLRGDKEAAAIMSKSVTGSTNTPGFTLQAIPEQTSSFQLKSKHQSANEDSSVAADSSEKHPQQHLSDFIDGVITQHDIEGEFKDLVEIFKNDIELNRGSSTRRLITQLTPITSSANGELDTESKQHTCRCLRLLARLAVGGEGLDDSEQNDEEKRWLQCVLNGFGVSAVALSMSSCDDDSLFEAGIELCVKLLDGGNAEVQATMLCLMSDPNQQLQVTPFDGSKSTFLASMRERLRLGCKEIISRKLYLEQQATLNDPTLIAQETAGLGAAAKKRYIDNLNKPFNSRARVVSVLRTLQLLAEGHNTTLQDYLRVQPGEPTNIDLVSEVYELVQNLDGSSLDGANIDQILQGLATLTELVQGNKSGGTASALLGTKLLEQLDALLAWSVTSKPVKKAGILKIDVLRLQREVSVLIISLQESETQAPGYIEEQMLRKLNIERLATLTSVTMKEVGQKEVDLSDGKAEAEELQKEIGTNMYILLRYLLDFECKGKPDDVIQLAPWELRTLEALHSFTYKPLEQSRDRESPPTKVWRVPPEVRQYYARHVGSVEICNLKGGLTKQFFPIPDMCLKLLNGNGKCFPKAEQLKDKTALILWGAGRATGDGRR